MRQIAYQRNTGGIVALLPDGRVEFLDYAIEPLLQEVTAGLREAKSIPYEAYIIRDPLVTLQRFHLAAPAIAFIEVTNLCNLRCKHCYADSAFRRPNEMETAMILQLLDEFAEMGVLQIFLTGGELFAHPDACLIIQHAMSKPFSTQIFTNGTLITEERLASLPKGTSFFISFDTADPERTIRGGMDFPKLRQCFEQMKAHGHIFRTAISVHRQNIDDAEEIFEWCVQNGYPRPQWIETHPIGRALLHPDILLQPEDVDRVFEIYKRCMDRYGSLPTATSPTGSTSEMYALETIKFCQSLEEATQQEKCARSFAYVNSAGDVYPCSNCMSNTMFRGGNLRERSFREIWEEGFDTFRSITFAHHEVCTSCPVHEAEIWCQFRCPPLAANVSHDLLGCGATEYLRLFMLRSHEYWEERRRRNIKLTLLPAVGERGAAP